MHLSLFLEVSEVPSETSTPGPPAASSSKEVGAIFLIFCFFSDIRILLGGSPSRIAGIFFCWSVELKPTELRPFIITVKFI